MRYQVSRSFDRVDCAHRIAHVVFCCNHQLRSDTQDRIRGTQTDLQLRQPVRDLPVLDRGPFNNDDDIGSTPTVNALMGLSYVIPYNQR